MKKISTIISLVLVAIFMLAYVSVGNASVASYSSSQDGYRLEVIDVKNDAGMEMCIGGNCQNVGANPTMEFKLTATTRTELVRGPTLKRGLPSGAGGEFAWHDINHNDWSCSSQDFVVECKFSLTESEMDGYKLEDVAIQLNSATEPSPSPAILLTSCVAESSIHNEFNHAKMCSLITNDEDDNPDEDDNKDEDGSTADTNLDEGGNELPGMGNDGGACSLNPAAASNSGGLFLSLMALAYIMIRRKR